MKVTLKAFNNVAHAYDSFLAQKNSMPSVAPERCTASQHATNNLASTDIPLLVSRCSTRTLGNTLLYGFSPTVTWASEWQTLTLLKKTPLPTSDIYPCNLMTPPALDRVSTTYVPTSTNPPTGYPLAQPQTWFFSFATRELRNATTCIQLTAIESLLIKTLTLSTARICSKQELISGIEKDPQTYSGLEMCLSRLQNKFRGTYNERLFRSVRNRGYCLVQDIKIIH